MSDVRGTRLSHDERRAQLVRLGLEMLGERPYDQVSIGSIARTAGISKGLLYHYFPTKSDFVVAVLCQSRDELDARMAPDLSLPPVQRLDASLDAFLDYVAEHATGFLAVARARGGDDEQIRAVLEEGRRRRITAMGDFAAALADVGRDELRCPALEAVLEGWLAFSEGVVVRWLRGGDDLERAQVHALIRHGLLAALESVAAVEPAPAFARLAEAARAAQASSPAGAAAASAAR